MDYLADLLLIGAAAAAVLYCAVLSRRLSRLNGLDTGLGAAIATLSLQVDQMTAALEQAQSSSAQSQDVLEGASARAEDVAARLEVLLASFHDIPEIETRLHQLKQFNAGSDLHGTGVR